MKTLTILLTLVILLLSLSSCKKQTTQPKVDEPVTCNFKTSGELTSSYRTTTTLTKDTIQLTFIKDNCPDNSLTYKISNLNRAFSNWGSSIQERDYYVNIDNDSKTGSITDTLTLKVEGTSVYISAKSGNKFTPYLPFAKLN